METQTARLTEHLKQGFWIEPQQAFKMFGISPTAYHRRIGDFKEGNPDYRIESKWIKTRKSRYKRHRAIKVAI